MRKYRVTLPLNGNWISVVEARDDKEAVDLALTDFLTAPKQKMSITADTVEARVELFKLTETERERLIQELIDAQLLFKGYAIETLENALRNGCRGYASYSDDGLVAAAQKWLTDEDIALCSDSLRSHLKKGE